MPLAASTSQQGAGSSGGTTNAGQPSNDDGPAASAATRAKPSSGVAAVRPQGASSRPAGDAADASAPPPTTSTTTTLTPSSAGETPSSSSSAPARPAAPPSITSSNTPPSRTSALLSRINLPSFTIRSRNRHVLDFHIRPDEPHKTYNAGDTVRGHVNIAIVKPVRITHLVVALHGYIQVFKDASSKTRTAGAAVHPRGGISELPQYHGNGLASLFQDEQVLAGEGRLEAGRYEFGFELIFPDIGLPSSIDVCLPTSALYPFTDPLADIL